MENRKCIIKVTMGIHDLVIPLETLEEINILLPYLFNSRADNGDKIEITISQVEE